MKTIILSPHFDDATLSCGGWIYDCVQRREDIEVWTLCAGHPVDDDFSALAVEYHANWDLTAGEAIGVRRGEDITAMGVLGVSYRHFAYVDALYRKHPRSGEHLYPDEESLFGGLHPGDLDIMQLLAIQLAESLPAGEVRLVSPLTVGNHADHLLVRAAVEQLSAPVWYYPDYPYSREYPDVAGLLGPEGFAPRTYEISPAGLAAWQESAAAYSSQISSFWASEEAMRQDIVRHTAEFNGISIWQPNPTE